MDLDIRRNRYITWATRILTFAACILWVFGCLAVGLLLLPGLTNYMEAEAGFVKGSFTMTAIIVWYFITIVIVSAYVAMLGYKMIGEWVSEGSNGEEVAEAPDCEEEEANDSNWKGIRGW